MTLWSRLASAMVLLVAATIGVLGLFSHGFWRRRLAGAIAIVLAGRGRHRGRPARACDSQPAIAQMRSRCPAADPNAAWSGTWRHRRPNSAPGKILLENTVESIRDAVIVVDENAVVVVANAAARRLLGVDRGFDSLTGTRNFTCFLADGVTPLPIPDSPLARALRGENIDDFELVVQPEAPGARAYDRRQRPAVARRSRPSSRRGDGAARRHRTKAGAPGAGRQRTDGAVHRPDRARRLRSDRPKRLRPRLEPAGRSLDRLDPGGGGRREGGGSGFPGAGARCARQRIAQFLQELPAAPWACATKRPCCTGTVTRFSSKCRSRRCAAVTAISSTPLSGTLPRSASPRSS